MSAVSLITVGVSLGMAETSEKLTKCQFIAYFLQAAHAIMLAT